MINDFDLVTFVEENKISGDFENLRYLLVDDLHDYMKIRVNHFKQFYNGTVDDYTLQLYCLGLLVELNRRIQFNFCLDSNGNIVDKGEFLAPSFQWRDYCSKGNFSVLCNCCYTFGDVSTILVPQKRRPTMEEKKKKRKKEK